MASLVDQEHTKWINIKDVHTVMASMPIYKTILFSDGKTKLIDYLSALENPKNYEKFLDDISDVNVSLPSDSPLWPGSTPLHLAVMFSVNVINKGKAAQLVNKCLKQGALIQVQNQRGATPLHLAFRMKQQQIMALLMRSFETKSATNSKEQVVNSVDNDNLSYLHIACTVNDHRSGLAQKLLFDKRGIKATVNIPYKGETLVNVKPGWTPLYVAVDQRQYYLTEVLLQGGADILCTDDEGSTVIHQLFGTTGGTKRLAKVLFASANLKDFVHANTGLSHLHVAVWFDDVKSVERLLDAGADIETTVKTLPGRDMEEFEGYSPLRMAMALDHIGCVKTLMRRGANVLAKKCNDSTTPLSVALSRIYKNQSDCSSEIVAKAFISIFWDDDKMQMFLEEELGLTKLHIACYSRDIVRFTALINQGANVNAKISDNSNFWKSYTPLHVATNTRFQRSRNKGLLTKLLKTDCDIDQQESTGKTALHLAVLSETCYSPNMVRVLLSAGADINVVDLSGKSAICYASEISNRKRSTEYTNFFHTLIAVVYKMTLTGIEVSEVNKTNITTVRNTSKSASLIFQNTSEFRNELTNKIFVGRFEWTVRSFLFETGAISMYPSLTPDDRSKVAAVFKSSINNQKSFDWKFLRNLQYRKAEARLSLIEPAVEALKDFISPDFPDLCAVIILEYLSNSELKLLIAASQMVN